MARLLSLLDGLGHRITMRRWKRHLSRIRTLDPQQTRDMERRARQLHRISRRVLAELHAISLPPSIDATGGRSRHSWAFRPDLWITPIFPAAFIQPDSGTVLSPGTTLYGDGAKVALNAAQVRSQSSESIAPYALTLETRDYTGTFASIALDLPEESWRGLTKSELIGLEVRLTVSGPCKVFGRANIRHGPNTDKLVREINLSQGTDKVEFDLLYSAIEVDRISGMWLDLIFEDPANTRITIEDCVITRHPRANV